MKILFLDIDGVVNCETTAQRHRGAIGIDPYMAFLVARIVERTGCKVVLSSSWRHFPDGCDEVARQVVPLLDVTPKMPLFGGADQKERGHEIKAWLDEHPEVTRYAILDDNSDMLDEQLPNFFKTSWATGITEEIAEKVVRHLGWYPLLDGAPEHQTPEFIEYLRVNNPVIFENESWIVIENCKYHKPDRPWLTAFAKAPYTIPSFDTLEQWMDWEWKKKSVKEATIKRFHIHMYPRV